MWAVLLLRPGMRALAIDPIGVMREKAWGVISKALEIMSTQKRTA